MEECGFGKYINTFVEDRTEEILYEIATSNTEFQELSSEFIRLQDEIISFLGDRKGLMFDLECVINSQTAINCYAVYKHAFQDGIKISGAIGRIKGEKI